MSAGRRGRPYQVPEDRTSLRASTVDVDARVGWLLLMSRLHHRNAELALGGPFMAALSELGLQADRSAVSRWESGKMQPRFSVLTAYERVLELRQGQLSTVVNALRRAFSPEGQRAWAPVLDPQSEAFHLRLDHLLDILLSDKATGPDWTEFGYFASAPDMLYLHGSVWRELSFRLVDQVARSVGLAYLQRFETIRILLEHRIAQSWLLRAAGDYLSDPSVQIVNDPVGVLEISPAPEAATVLLEKFVQTESESVFEATISGIAYKLGMGQFSPAEMDRIESTLMRAMHHRESELGGLEEVMIAMPQAAQNRLMDASRGLRGHQSLATVAAHGEWVRPETAKRVSQLLADRIRAELPSAALYDEDLMTPRIIREALFSARGEHRHLASLLLLGSPFRTYLAAALTEQIDASTWDDPAVSRMLRLLRYLAGPEQEPTLLRWVVTADDEVIRDIALTLGHLPPSGADLSVLVDRLKGDNSMVDRGVLYGLGMRQDRALITVANDQARPAVLRNAASWWLRQGGAVLD
jgi:transcriptional regulator with XRE-family HTH domain